MCYIRSTVSATDTGSCSQWVLYLDVSTRSREAGAVTVGGSGQTDVCIRDAGGERTTEFHAQGIRSGEIPGMGKHSASRTGFELEEVENRTHARPSSTAEPSRWPATTYPLGPHSYLGRITARKGMPSYLNRVGAYVPGVVPTAEGGSVPGVGEMVEGRMWIRLASVPGD